MVDASSYKESYSTPICEDYSTVNKIGLHRFELTPGKKAYLDTI